MDQSQVVVMIAVAMGALNVGFVLGRVFERLSYWRQERRQERRRQERRQERLMGEARLA